ncbi:stage II sporulation protein R [Neobacillus sp.]|uniref:stage II sporulation protein R n=1 Tax=Neobacillus sp. TaxID=2675273 RepID=UPI00289F42E6|nr:stage II sporulation protein R [Neobacillus sp.]
MRSKIVVWAYLVVLSMGTMLSLYMPKTEAAQKESIVIPGEAIRLRILANSDFEADQAIKRKVRDAVNAQITLWVQDLTSMEKARTLIKAKLPEIQAIAEKVVREQASVQSVKVEFGNVQFPTKLYGQYLYPAGEYQAILITLGSGEGANWWCVLYPPLCFLDFSNGVAVSNGFDEKQKAAAKAPEKEEKSSERVEQVPNSVDEEVVAKEPQEEPTKESVSFDKERAVEISDEKSKVTKEPALEKTEKKHAKKQKQAPVYTAADEEPVKVKFFVVEMWEKLFY